MATGRTVRNASASVSFRASKYLRDERDIAAYLEAMLEDGEPLVVPAALHTVADAVGGMAVLTERSGLSRETLYRTLSDKGSPRLNTLAAILHAFRLRISVATERSP